MFKKIIACMLTGMLLVGNAYAAGPVKHEYTSTDAASSVLYGTSDAGDSIVRVKTAADGTIQATVSGVVTPSAPFEITDTNTIYIDINANIETAIAAATAGDTIVLAAGTYDVGADIDIAQSINVVGQGIGHTIITCDDASVNVFDITSDDVRIANLSISTTGATNRGINVDGTAGAVFENIVIEDVNITMSSSGIQSGIVFDDSFYTLRNIVMDITSSDSGARGVPFTSSATAEKGIIGNAYNLDITCSAAGGQGYGFLSNDAGGSSTIVANIYNSVVNIGTGATTRYCTWVLGTDASINAYNCTFNASEFDVYTQSGTTTLYDTTLVNGTTSGTITYGGTVVTGSLVVGENADTQTFTNDGTDVFHKWSDGKLKFQSNESADADTRVQVIGNGTGSADLLIEDQSNANYWQNLVQQDANARWEFGSAVTTVDIRFGAGAVFEINDGMVDVDTHINSDTGIAIQVIGSDGGVFMAQMKAGVDQATAGAAANELWSDTNDDNTVKLGV